MKDDDEIRVVVTVRGRKHADKLMRALMAWSNTCSLIGESYIGYTLPKQYGSMYIGREVEIGSVYCESAPMDPVYEDKES